MPRRPLRAREGRRREVNHKNCKCMFFREGMVLNESCDKVIAHCFCDLDEMEEDKPCTADACRYYARQKEKEGGADASRD